MEVAVYRIDNCFLTSNIKKYEYLPKFIGRPIFSGAQYFIYV